jgi:AmiR/NasT family two-component response regulator
MTSLEEPLPEAAAWVEQVANLQQRVEHLTKAVESNRAIGVAIGITVERCRVDRAVAFDLLTRLSQNSNVKLRHVADDVIEQAERRGERLNGSSPDPSQLGS